MVADTVPLILDHVLLLSTLNESSASSFFAYPGFRALYPNIHMRRLTTAERGSLNGYSGATEAEI